MHRSRWCAGQRFDALGVEAELEDVARLALSTGELGVDCLPARCAKDWVFDALDEVSDPSDAAADEWHLVEDISVGDFERVPDPLDPLLEGLTQAPSLGVDRHDLLPIGQIRGEAISLVGLSFGPQQIGERSRRLHGEHLASRPSDRERERVLAAEPARDDRRGKSHIGHGGLPSFHQTVNQVWSNR